MHELVTRLESGALYFMNDIPIQPTDKNKEQMVYVAANGSLINNMIGKKLISRAMVAALDR